MANPHALDCDLPPGDGPDECAICADLLDEVADVVGVLAGVVG